MSKKNKKRFFNMNNKEKEGAKRSNIENVEEVPFEVEDVAAEDVEDAEEVEELKDAETELQQQVDDLKAQLEKEKKEYLFLMADFDNFRKRTIREKGELLKNGAENAMKDLLPIIDDFERGIKAIDESDDINAVKEGIDIIYNKFVKYLEKNGVKAIDTEAGTEFDVERHEAVTAFPTEDESMKGKIIDTVQKGYTLNDKVLRHSKVVVGQ